MRRAGTRRGGGGIPECSQAEGRGCGGLAEYQFDWQGLAATDPTQLRRRRFTSQRTIQCYGEDAWDDRAGSHYQAKSRAQRALPLRQRQEIQEMLWRLMAGLSPSAALTLIAGTFANILPPPANSI